MPGTRLRSRFREKAGRPFRVKEAGAGWSEIRGGEYGFVWVSMVEKVAGNGRPLSHESGYEALIKQPMVEHSHAWNAFVEPLS